MIRLWRSAFGTGYQILFCKNCLYDWSVYGFSRKIIALSLFILIATALTPLLVRSQQPNSATLSVRVDDLQSRLNRLDSMPTDIADIRARLSTIEEWQKSTSTTITYIIIGVFGTIGLKLLEVFGLRVKRRDE
jgi:hypothetical protein